MEMKKSYLIQRLRTPDIATTTTLGKIKAAFAFGGGLKNGGLSDDAMKLIDNIWSFDYMGSAEFEFGAVPKTLHSIAECQEDLICNSFITYYEFQSYRWSWGDEDSKEHKGNSRVYYICRKEQQKEVKTRISRWALHRDYDGVHGTKEPVLLDKSMSGCKEKHGQPVTGWLELDNGFMFFTDETMWRNTCQLFGIRTPSKKKVSKQK